jgi:hypothetical protein
MSPRPTRPPLHLANAGRRTISDWPDRRHFNNDVLDLGRETGVADHVGIGADCVRSSTDKRPCPDLQHSSRHRRERFQHVVAAGPGQSRQLSQPRYLDDERAWWQRRLFSATTAHNDLVTFINQNLTIFGANPQENVNYYIYLSTLNDGYDTVAIVSRWPFISTHIKRPDS